MSPKAAARKRCGTNTIEAISWRTTSAACDRIRKGTEGQLKICNIRKLTATRSNAERSTHAHEKALAEMASGIERKVDERNRKPTIMSVNVWPARKYTARKHETEGIKSLRLAVDASRKRTLGSPLCARNDRDVIESEKYPQREPLTQVDDADKNGSVKSDRIAIERERKRNTRCWRNWKNRSWKDAIRTVPKTQAAMHFLQAKPINWNRKADGKKHVKPIAAIASRKCTQKAQAQMWSEKQVEDAEERRPWKLANLSETERLETAGPSPSASPDRTLQSQSE
jgi:hypothetical protein